MTDHITIPIDVIEAAVEALGNFVSDHGWTDSDMQAMDNLDAYIARHKANQAARAELAKPADLAAEMSAVADQFAHKLALDLECVLADYSGTWYDTAINTLGAYREAMNAIHERESPTFMGEPVLSSDELAKPAQHGKPDVAALKAERDELRKDAERYRWLAAHTRRTSEHWGGRWSIVIDGPAPKSHNSEDDLDDAIDAAMNGEKA